MTGCKTVSSGPR